MPGYTPSAPRTEQVENLLRIGWDLGVTPPGSWSVHAAGGDGRTLTSATLPGTATRWEVPDLPADVPIAVTVAAAGTEFPVAPVTVTARLVPGDPPRLWNAFFDAVAGTLRLDWNADPTCATGGYTAQLLDPTDIDTSAADTSAADTVAATSAVPAVVLAQAPECRGYPGRPSVSAPSGASRGIRAVAASRSGRDRRVPPRRPDCETGLRYSLPTTEEVARPPPVAFRGTRETSEHAHDHEPVPRSSALETPPSSGRALAEQTRIRAPRPEPSQLTGAKGGRSAGGVSDGSAGPLGQGSQGGEAGSRSGWGAGRGRRNNRLGLVRRPIGPFCRYRHTSHHGGQVVSEAEFQRSRQILRREVLTSSPQRHQCFGGQLDVSAQHQLGRTQPTCTRRHGNGAVPAARDGRSSRHGSHPAHLRPRGNACRGVTFPIQ